ncbi:hypothetical protein BDP27DRAFT_1293370 [Rhodocollybia butyracea]|uniref:Uncharacterized protein n=1 Tax=Rhodocollybia butyracea TaxID=206335 RepID=A0A9P5U7I2_9AGAR|nr:hypothetical protein BDP27DRAFT_1293370 [Rhodocollybia butyracea]
MSSNFNSQNEHDVQSGSNQAKAEIPASSEPSTTSNAETTSGNVEEQTLPVISPLLPQIGSDADFGLDLDSIISAGDPELARVNKRASNVQKLAQENEKLKAELKAMTDRVEAAERRRQELDRKRQAMKEPPSE